MDLDLKWIWKQVLVWTWIWHGWFCVCVCVCVCVRDIIGISSLRQAPVIKRRPAISYQGEKPFVPTRWTEAEIKQISRKYQINPKQIPNQQQINQFHRIDRIHFNFLSLCKRLKRNMVSCSLRCTDQEKVLIRWLIHRSSLTRCYTSTQACHTLP